MGALLVGTPYTTFDASGPFDAIVIGSGIGGLGAAAALARAGEWRVLVLERHATAGGFTHTFHRPGFEWDVGVHYIGEVHAPGSPTAAMFDYISEGRLAWHAMPDDYDRVEIDGIRFDYVAGRDRLRDRLAQTFPHEARAIDRYFAAVDRCRRTAPLAFAAQSMPPLLDRTIGSALRAPVIISDAGVATTFTRLVDRSEAVEPLCARLAAIPASVAHLGLYVGVSTARLGGPLPASNLWIHPGPHYDRNWAAFAADLDAPFPLVFLSCPSAKDPTFARRYPGHGTIEAVVPAPYAPFAAWSGRTWMRRGEEYTALKARLADRLLTVIDTHLPGVRGALETWELSTPLSTRHFANAAHGETYGLAHTPARFLSRDLRPATPIRDLYLTGQDVGTCGVTGALAGALSCASVILRRNLFRLASAGGGRAERPPARRRAA